MADKIKTVKKFQLIKKTKNLEVKMPHISVRTLSLTRSRLTSDPAERSLQSVLLSSGSLPSLSSALAVLSSFCWFWVLTELLLLITGFVEFLFKAILSLSSYFKQFRSLICWVSPPFLRLLAFPPKSTTLLSLFFLVVLRSGAISLFNNASWWAGLILVV